MTRETCTSVPAPEHGVGLLLHTGSEIRWIAPGVLVAPWWRVL